MIDSNASINSEKTELPKYNTSIRHSYTVNYINKFGCFNAIHLHTHTYTHTHTRARARTHTGFARLSKAFCFVGVGIVQE